MKLIPLAIAGAFEIRLTRLEDPRGTFARTFCAKIFGDAGLAVHWQQMNMSRTIGRGSLRGMHFQRAPHEEAKLVRATEGAVHDVAVDLRAGSGTFGQHCAVRLSAEDANAFYIPEGCAHGFQTLVETATLHYCHSTAYAPASEGGLLATDPDLGIDWPLPIATMSDRDKALPKLQELTPL